MRPPEPGARSTVFHVPNERQIESWDGVAGLHWVAEAEGYDRMNRRFGERIVAVLDAKPRERNLDVGCGNGAMALAIAPLVAPDGWVTGLDVSGPMLAHARTRAPRAAVSNVSFEQGDAQVHPLPVATFDGVVSSFGVMFFDDPVAAFANIRRALKPGGRVVFACWQDLLRNEWIMVPAGAALEHLPMPDLGEPGAPGPFSLANPDKVRSVLHDADLQDVQIDDLVAPMAMGDSVDEAVAFMQHSDMGDALMKDVSDETAARAWAAVRDALEPHANAQGVELNGAAWLVRARN